MSIGNLKDSGNQGNNFPWQLKMLLGQQCACDELAAINSNTNNVEFLLSAILTSLQANTEYEAKFVVDTCDSNKVYLEVRLWDSDSSTWGPITYYLPGSSTPVTPVGASTPGCLIYTDPTGILGMIYSFLQTNFNVQLSTRASESTLSTLNAKFVNGTDIGDVTINNGDGVSAVKIQDGGNSITVDATSLPLPTGAATETTLGDIKTSVQLIDDCVGTDGATAPTKSFVIAGVTAGGTQQTIEVNTSGHVNIADGGGSITVDGGTGVQRTPTILRTSANSSVAAGAYSVSFASVGTVDATVGGATLKVGETISFDAGAINNTLGAITYNSSTAGAELLIITLT